MRLIPLHKESAATLTPAELDKFEQLLIRLYNHFILRLYNGLATHYINGGYDRNTLDEGYTTCLMGYSQYYSSSKGHPNI